jgi:hypothetical protein
MQRGYTTIDEIVNDMHLMIDDTSYSKDAKNYQLRLLALQGLKELTFDVEQVVKTIELTPGSTTLSAHVPDDFVKLIRIGYKGEDGNFHPLGYSSNLSLDASVSAQVGDSSYDENNPYYHTDLGKKYGVGGGKNVLGYYRINRNDQIINFSSEVSGKTVFLEYISDGVTEVPARNHILKITFNDSESNKNENGIKDNTKLVIPSPTETDKLETITFKGNGDDYEPTDSKTVVLIESSEGKITSNSVNIASRFTKVINEGYPERKIAPFSPQGRLTARNEGTTVYLTYTSTDFYKGVPLTWESTNSATATSPISASVNPGTFNVTEGPAGGSQVEGVKVLTAQEVVQLGNSGRKPRVHNFCEEALRCYIYYKYIQRKRGIPANEKQMAKRAYYNEKRLARARMMNFNKETAMQVSRKAFKQSPKI